MNKLEYKLMSDREKSYWWHVGRFEILNQQISSLRKRKYSNKKIRILNVGCGTGGTVSMLKKHASELINIDVSKEAIKFMNNSGHKAILVKGNRLPFKENEFDLIVAFDVLEHIKDENAAIKDWRRLLKKNGYLLVTVPAYQWLWSGHDVSLRHHRRYTSRSLRNVVEGAGLTTVRAAYMIVFSLPLIVGFRLLSKFKKELNKGSSYVDVHQSVNILFTVFLKAEAGLQRYIRMPLGTSVLAVFVKK